MAEPAFFEQPPEPDDESGSAGEDAPDTGGAAQAAYPDLRAEVTQLRRAMRTRPPIDKSMGVLMAAYSVSEDEAWKILVTVSQRTNTKLHAVAGEIVASTREDVVDAHLRRAIEAALKDLKAR